MLDENYGFCPHCGENLKSDALYCPACGTVLKQEALQQQYNSYSRVGKTPMSGMFLVAFIMLILYTLIELIGSASMLTFNEATYDSIDQVMIEMYGMTLTEYLAEFGMSISKDTFISNMMVLGISGVISAVLSGISAYFCFKREKHKYAVGFCVISSVVYIVGCSLAPELGGFASGVFGFVIGIIVALMIRSSKRYFNS